MIGQRQEQPSGKVEAQAQRLAPAAAFTVAGGSIVLGAAAILRPLDVARLLAPATIAGHTAGVRYYRLLGLRDIAVGAGLLAGLARGAAGPWLLARAGCDLIDCLTMGLPALQRRQTRQSLAGLALPLGSAALALTLRQVLRSTPT